MIKDGKAFCVQSAVSKVIIYDICTALSNLGPRKPKWVIGHNSSHGRVIMHFFGLAHNSETLLQVSSPVSLLRASFHKSNNSSKQIQQTILILISSFHNKVFPLLIAINRTETGSIRIYRSNRE